MGKLVLSRQYEEEVVIVDRESGETIAVVEVVGIHGLKVRLGFEADLRYEIHRREVYERILRERAALK